MNKVSIVTGAAQGIGCVIAEQLLQQGHKVVIGDINRDAAQRMVNDLEAFGESAVALELDVSSKESFQSVLSQTLTKFGRCDVLVNNASITSSTAVMDIRVEEFDQVLATNLRGTFLGCQVLGEHFLANKSGRIINMTSLAGQMGGTATGAHYAASKGGILTLTKVFAREFAGHGVTVNAVAPGPVDVPSIREKISEQKLNEIVETMIPVKCMSSADFIASMVCMLASDSADCVTGACWDSNGGIFMR